jgi:hypothetical protein
MSTSEFDRSTAELRPGASLIERDKRFTWMNLNPYLDVLYQGQQRKTDRPG